MRILVAEDDEGLREVLVLGLEDQGYYVAAVDRRLTFDVRGWDGLARDHVAGLVALAVALALTSASIAALQAVDPRAGRLMELAVIVAANGVATVVRFALLRLWIHPAPAVTAPAVPCEARGGIEAASCQPLGRPSPRAVGAIGATRGSRNAGASPPGIDSSACIGRRHTIAP